MRRTVLALGMLALALSGGGVRGEEAKMNQVYELRIYHAAPGKMKALHARFRDHTCALFKKHGITIVGFWSPIDAKEAERKLIYLLAYPSKAAADTSWKGFRTDPDWIKAKAESEKDGTLVEKIESVYMNPTDYSPLK